ncbi:hypothetical protein KVF89_25620 [Nocardioides carbamazepini]|uniref:hypothetical protein n=1 Tax=Nocardioides carbamazepini TaxID=2854259 RepID=UPI00214A3DFA|nr:hypothetical protein [Nocardioides carbamazepini]MCR1785940.1 hypothetical protein [Nocardioides carbamazepini]
MDCTALMDMVSYDLPSRLAVQLQSPVSHHPRRSRLSGHTFIQEQQHPLTSSADQATAIAAIPVMDIPPPHHGARFNGPAIAEHALVLGGNCSHVLYLILIDLDGAWNPLHR